MSSRKGHPARWDPIDLFPATDPGTGVGMAAAFYATGGRQHWYNYRTPQRAVQCLGFKNRLYNGNVLIFADGSKHVSFKRNDRTAVRDWRHFQAIKNEVAGADREAIEIFPPEHNLYDGANEYHLWVLPEGQESPLGLQRMEGETHLVDATSTHDNARYRQGGPAGFAQRAWEPGIPTGRGRER